MGILHSRDPVPDDARSLTDGEIAAAIVRAHSDRWEWVSRGEFELAAVCQRAVDRMLDALAARLSLSTVGVDNGGPEQSEHAQPCEDATEGASSIEGVIAECPVVGGLEAPADLSADEISSEP